MLQNSVRMPGIGKRREVVCMCGTWEREAQGTDCVTRARVWPGQVQCARRAGCSITRLKREPKNDSILREHAIHVPVPALRLHGLSRVDMLCGAGKTRWAGRSQAAWGKREDHRLRGQSAGTRSEDTRIAEL
jgi:hypothetical protein